MGTPLSRLVHALRALLSAGRRRGERATPASLFRAVSDTVHRAKIEAARGAAEVRRLEREREDRIRQADESARRAVAALAKGHDDLAREVVRREVHLRASAESLVAHTSDLLSRSAQMLASAQAMQMRLDSAQLRIRQITARETVAEAQARLGELRIELYGELGPGAFEHLDLGLDRQESQVAAWETITANPTASHSVDARTGASAVEHRIAELRQRPADGPPTV